jgi:ABC-2 type transport system ATP-binding protein
VAIVSRGRVVVDGAPETLKRALRGDAVTVELTDGDTSGALQVVERTAGVSETMVETNRVHARVEHGAAAVPVILGSLDAAGIAVSAVTVSRPSLDDVYLHHTGRDFSSDDAAGAA